MNANYAHFVDLKLKPANEIRETLTDSQIDLTHCSLGLAGEAGEVVDEIKKHAMTGRDLDRDKIIKELGDCLFYMQGICNVLDLSFDEIIKANILKLDKRYADGYSDAACAERVDVE